MALTFGITLFCGLTLVTGSIWGRPTWNTYWEWGDVRLVTTLILFVMMIGYLAVRSMGGDESAVATRAAVVGVAGSSRPRRAPPPPSAARIIPA